MKNNCTNCTHFKNKVCEKNKKNAYNNCKIFTGSSISEMQNELNKLRVNGLDKAREVYLREYLEYFNWGIKNN